MAVVYLLAHFDDEYCALPMVMRRAQAGIEQHFLYVADYATPDLARRRLAETRNLLAHLEIDPSAARHVGAGTGAQDGAVHKALPSALAVLRESLAAVPVDRLVVPAWEGGHPDHDACAFLAVKLAAELPNRPPVEQFGLYNGRGLRAPLFRACAPIPENGPVERVRLQMADWLRYFAGVRFFPSQMRTWAGLWPMMFAQFVLGGGFAHQRLAPDRVLERPHAGSLLYEQRMGLAYAELRRALDAL